MQLTLQSDLLVKVYTYCIYIHINAIIQPVIHIVAAQCIKLYIYKSRTSVTVHVKHQNRENVVSVITLYIEVGAK